MDVLHERFRPIFFGILALGLGAALLIFVFAEIAPANPLGESRAYVHDMLLYGGKTNMVLGELAEWIGSLWQGKRLAGTVAAITLLLAGAFYYFFSPVAPETGEKER